MDYSSTPRSGRTTTRSANPARGIPTQRSRASQAGSSWVTASSPPTAARPLDPEPRPVNARPPASSARVRSPAWLTRYRRRLLVTDLAIVAAAVLIAQLVRVAGIADPATGQSQGSDWVFDALLAATWATCLAVEGVWDTAGLGVGFTEYRRILVASLVVFAIVGMVGYFTANDLARAYLVVAIPLGVIGLLVDHALSRWRLAAHQRSGSRLRTVVLVGDRVDVSELCTVIRGRSDAGYQVTGVCVPADGGDRPHRIEGVPVIGDVPDVAVAAVDAGASSIAVAGSASSLRARVPELALRLEGTGIRLLVAPEIADVAGPRTQIRPIEGLPLMRVDEPRFEGARGFAKITLDLAVALIGLVVLSPLMLVAAIAVLVADGGPILVRREFVGRGGRACTGFTFRCLPYGTKARALLAGGDSAASDAVGYHLPVTAVGRVLRRVGLDESPLLCAVLARQIAVVGPEPRLAGDPDPGGRPLRVRPGITGPWRVDRGQLPAGPADRADRAMSDARYVEDWSMIGDIAIMARTVRQVLGGRDPR